MSNPDAPQDPFEPFRRLWGPLGLPVPGMATPTLDPQEVEKLLQQLKSVEAWLSMNLNLLRVAVQGLEAQKAALLALGAGAPPGGAARDPLLWPWGALHRAVTGGAPPPGETGPEGERKKGA